MKFDWELLRRILGEFTGSLMLVFLGCMSCIAGPVYPRDMLDIGIGWGLAVLCPVHCFGFLSQCHINPAVSLCAFILGLIELPMMFIYMVIQLIGCFVGFGLVYAAMPKNLAVTTGIDVVKGVRPKLCVCNPDLSIKIWQAIFIEYIMTSVLLFSVCGVWDARSGEKFDSASVRLGFVVAGLVFVSGPYTGACLNMARALPPHIIQTDFKNLWIYLVGQLLAAVITPLLWRFALTPKGEGGSKDAE